VTLFTFPLVAPLSSLIFSVWLSLVPWNPPAASASSAFWAAASSFAVRVIVPVFWSHTAVTPSTFLTISSTALTHWGQHRWVPFSTTLVSARAAPPENRTRIPMASNCSVFMMRPSCVRPATLQRGGGRTPTLYRPVSAQTTAHSPTAEQKRVVRGGEHHL